MVATEARIDSIPRIDNGSRSEWRTVRFDQTAENITDRVDDPAAAGVEYYVGLEHLDPESLKIRRWGAPTDVEATKLRFRPGDIIFGRRRAYQRKLAVAEFEGICSAHALVLRARPETVIPEFLPFFMQSDTFFERALAISVGSLSPTINWKTLARQEFSIPPKDEQRRIADILSAVEQDIEQHIRVERATETLYQTLVEALIHPQDPRDREARTDRVPLGQVSEVVYGLTLNAARDRHALRLPYLRVANVARGTVVLDDVKTVGCSPEDAERYRLKSGDVLVVEGHANIDEIGRAALWDNQVEHCLHQNHLLRVRCADELDSRFLLAFLNSNIGRAYFRRCAKSTSGLNTINSQVLKEMIVPLPPKERQMAAVETLSEVVGVQQAIARHRAALDSLRRHLRDELLSVGGAVAGYGEDASDVH